MFYRIVSMKEKKIILLIYAKNFILQSNIYEKVADVLFDEHYAQLFIFDCLQSKYE